MYDKRDDFDFDIVNFEFFDGGDPRTTSYSINISQITRFARVSNHLTDFNARNKGLTAKLLQQGYRYHKLRKDFSNLYRRHFKLVKFACDVYDGVFMCCPFSHEVSWMRS